MSYWIPNDSFKRKKCPLIGIYMPRFCFQKVIQKVLLGLSLYWLLPLGPRKTVPKSTVNPKTSGLAKCYSQKWTIGEYYNRSQKKVVPHGLEPWTPWLWVRCSNQLSYGTVIFSKFQLSVHSKVENFFGRINIGSANVKHFANTAKLFLLILNFLAKLYQYAICRFRMYKRHQFIIGTFLGLFAKQCEPFIF